MRVAKPALKILVIVYFFWSHITNNIGYHRSDKEIQKSITKIKGLYDINSFVMNQDTLSYDHPLRWQQLILGDKIQDAVRLNGDSIAFISLAIDKKRILVSADQTRLFTQMQLIYNEFGPTDDTYEKMDSILVARNLVNSLNFRVKDATIELKGLINKDSVSITATRKLLRPEDFRLIKRQFHWVNEASYFY